MRLTQIKLSGFKSFVDPTSINVPGNLVGVVGPNGCGKSNIIDAVRWVLGESRAAALRGESMQDVIFNGSVQRKPVARASVELVFDNHLGRAAGQWSQYAEISVKRVLQRDGESLYSINGTTVRRRDVQDIFLGTGVGPRAYAIIEQGTISRVIEAKPEELRVFLEEAAGVSKYRERRRETENRLEDTRENLLRVDDIRRELESSIGRLARQAEVAGQYQTMQKEQSVKQQLLWWLRKREAQEEAARVAGELERATRDIDAHTARLREVEVRLESTRVRHYEAGDTANAIQGELYGVNSEVARLESELRHVGETRQRLHARGAQYVTQLNSSSRQWVELGDALQMWQLRGTELAGLAVAAGERRLQEEEQVGALEGELKRAQDELVAARATIAEAERALQVEQTRHVGALERIRELDARRARLESERGALDRPQPALVERLLEQMRAFDRQLSRFGDELTQRTARLPATEARRAEGADQVERLGRDLSGAQARLKTLEGLQASAERDETLDAWIGRHGLGRFARLWELMSVAPGWERAVESVLRERLHGLAVDEAGLLDRLLQDPAPANVAIVPAAGTLGEATAVEQHEPAPARRDELGLPADARALSALVSVARPSFAVAVQRWLSGVYVIERTPAAAELAVLAGGVGLVDQEGALYERDTVRFYAGPAGEANILVRKREIERLGSEVGRLERELQGLRLVLAESERRAAAERGRIGALQSAVEATREVRHRAEIDWTKLAELRAGVETRSAEIEKELAEVMAEQERAAAQAAEHVELVEQHSGQHARSREEFGRREAVQQSLEQQVSGQRDALRGAERAAQEAQFAVRESEAKMAEIRRSLEGLRDQIANATREERALREELAALVDADLKVALQNMLKSRLAVEARLTEARGNLETVTAALRTTEEERFTVEQQLAPLRDSIAELRLKQQAARLACEQFAQQLSEVGADEAAIETIYVEANGRGMRPQTLQTEINRLGQQMAALGAINMAALEELGVASERKEFLDAQANDLNEALGTLESAIRRIDLETRALLQNTFDSVNRNFSAMFPTLFAGGQAKLVMTGEEILDAGVQVMAQPPGKRNASIHLLSGGEKALTAIALVFSLFQLNPAPFCLLDEVDAPLDDSNTERFCSLVRQMSNDTQFVFISHNKITMEMANQLVGVTMQEQGVSRIVAVDIDEALKLREAA